MADVYNTMTTLQGNFKNVYEDKIARVIPQQFKLLREFKFRQNKALGEYFVCPIVLGLEHGYTYAAPNSGAYDLNDAVAGSVKRATIQGYQGTLKSLMDLETAANAASGRQGAFEEATQYLVEAMTESCRKRQEIDLWWGQKELGTVASIATKDITITTAEWAPGNFAGMEGAPVEIFTANLGVKRDDGSGNSVFKITKVNVSARIVTVEAVTGGGAPSGVISTDRILFKGQFSGVGGAWQSALGLHAVATNTGSMWNIDAASYSFWKAETVAVGGNLSYDKVQELIAVGVGKGLEGRVKLFVNPQTWKKLITAEAGRRQYDVSYSPSVARNGAESIEFVGQSGVIDIVSSIYEKEGLCHLMQEGFGFRVGSEDLTFKIPGLGDQMVVLANGKNGFELRMYHNFSFFTPYVSRLVYGTGVTNT